MISGGGLHGPVDGGEEVSSRHWNFFAGGEVSCGEDGPSVEVLGVILIEQVLNARRYAEACR